MTLHDVEGLARDQDPTPRLQAGSVSASERWTIFVLTCRKPEIDFRFPLARELAELGHDVDYVFLKRRPSISHLSDPTAPARTVSLPDLLRRMRSRLRGTRRGLVLNSTNLVFPGISRGLRLLAGGVWCLDLHDDLLYEHEGWRRRKAQLAQSILVRGADLAVHAAPTLAELFPRSHHLGNASDMVPVEREGFQTDRVLVLASLDGRFDFDFLAQCAGQCSAVTFDIYGQISRKSAATQERVDALTAAHPNVVYHGAYTNSQLPRILSSYSVTLAPYVTGSRLTHFIDPLRYYHCLNSGMEVITTDIPAAISLADHLTVITAPDELPSILQNLQRHPEARRNSTSTADIFNWRAKASRFISVVDDHVRQSR